MPATWDEMKTGRQCPLCAPRPDFSEFHYRVAQLAHSTLYLARNQHYYGLCTLIYDVRHATRIAELTPQEWIGLAAELWLASRAIDAALAPEHMNIETLGNQIPHLHWYLVPRRKNDGRWGAPIWTTRREEMPSVLLEEAQYAQLAKSIKHGIDELAVETRS
jgi:diadenosine tetraphosphate (Ap4A) HIT family hydrolase